MSAAFTGTGISAQRLRLNILNRSQLINLKFEASLALASVLTRTRRVGATVALRLTESKKLPLVPSSSGYY